MPSAPTSIDFWFDPICQYTWRTSRWITDVGQRRGIPIRWHLMSLAVLNEGTDVTEEYRAGLAKTWGPLRVLAAAARISPEAVPKLYSALGNLVHTQGAELDDSALVAALAAAGLPGDLAQAGGDTAYDKAIRASHAAGQARMGADSGSPIIALGDGPGFFGPVVVPVPTGEDALALFDAVAILSGVPAFSELKRARAAL